MKIVKLILAAVGTVFRLALLLPSYHMNKYRSIRAFRKQLIHLKIDSDTIELFVLEYKNMLDIYKLVGQYRHTKPGHIRDPHYVNEKLEKAGG